MTRGDLLIRVAQWIAGASRREWVDAIETEPKTLGDADFG